MDRSKQNPVKEIDNSSAEPGFFQYLGSVPKQLDHWMFGHGSPVTMGVLRLVIGGLAFINLLLISVGFEDWFTEGGFVPLELNRTYAGDVWRLNFLGGVYDGRIALAFYSLVTVSAFFTMIGLWSRWSSAILALGMITLHHRNMVILHGGDVILRMAIFYVAFSPSGAACSVDRLIALWKGKAPLIPANVSMWPQRLMAIQVAIVYYTTVWGKWMGFRWKDGTATYYPLHLNEFKKFWFPEFLRDNLFFNIVSTYGTLIVELALATIVFYKPLRRYAVLGGVGLHLFIEYTMNIPLFAFIMMATYLAFYEGDEMSACAKRIGERLKRYRVKLWVPSGSKMGDGPEAALKATDPFDLVEYSEGGTNKDWESEDSEGRKSTAKRGLIRSVGAWPLALLPKMWDRVLNKSLK